MESGGLGVGLAVTKEIIDRHNGTITVESELGKGTTFTLWLPAAADRAEPAPAILPAEAPPRFAGRTGSADVEHARRPPGVNHPDAHRPSARPGRAPSRHARRSAGCKRGST